MDEDIIAIIAMSLIVGAPVLAFSARIAIRPIVESIARLKEAFKEETAADLRLARLEEEMDRLRGEVRQLKEAEDFRKQLRSP